MKVQWKKKNISNTFIHFGKVKDQWDETVKLVKSQLKSSKRKKTLLVKWKEKSFYRNYGQNINLHVTIQMFCLYFTVCHMESSAANSSLWVSVFANAGSDRACTAGRLENNSSNPCETRGRNALEAKFQSMSPCPFTTAN